MAEVQLPGASISISGHKETVSRTIRIGIKDETLRQKNLVHVLHLTIEEAQTLAKAILEAVDKANS